LENGKRILLQIQRGMTFHFWTTIFSAIEKIVIIFHFVHAAGQISKLMAEYTESETFLNSTAADSMLN